MKRFVWILGLAMGAASALILISLVNRQRMGEMLDLAYDPSRDRLYTVAGDRGVYTFEVKAGRLDRISRFYDEGYYRNLEIQGERAYVAERERGLLVLDISSDRPRIVYATQDLSGQGIHVAGGLLYLAAGQSGLIIYSLADPDSPQEIGRYVNLDDAWDVAVEGHLAYVVDEARGLEILDVSSPTQPMRLGFITWDPVYAQAMVVRAEAGFVFIAAGQHGLMIVDARNANIPVIAAEYKPGPDSFAEGLAVKNGMLYLAIGDEQNGNLNGLHILDVRNPYNPQLITSTTYAERTEGIILHSETLFLANPWAGVRTYAIGDPSQPRLVDRFRYFP
jgi:hypothetical protein